MAALLPVLRQRFFDASGNPLAGGKLHSYVAGTSTPTATYTDQAGTVPNTNPIILDANGECNAWLISGYYKFVLRDSNDVVQWTVDNVWVDLQNGGGFGIQPPNLVYAGPATAPNALAGFRALVEADIPNLTTAKLPTIPILKGGTGQTTKAAGFDALSPMTTGGDIIYGGASGTGARLANGSLGQYLKSNGGTNAPTWEAPQIYSPIRLILTATGSGTVGLYYILDVTSANATAGAQYTNNGFTFDVYQTISSGTKLILYGGSGAPLSSGTLTKSSGTGDSTITFSFVKAPLFLRAKVIGGGGGGAGGGVSAGNGGNGGASSFGTSLLTANGGNGGTVNANAGGTGGSATINSPAYGLGFSGGTGGSGTSVGLSSSYASGGFGANSPLGGAGPGSGSTNLAAATSARANSGSGGGGGGVSPTASGYFPGGGGGSGAYIDAVIPGPLNDTYAFTVGTGGSSGSAGTSGFAGGAGGSGLIDLEFNFQ